MSRYDELKPCPFCGCLVMPTVLNGYGEECRYEPDLDERFEYFKCYGCDTIFAHSEPKDDWNSQKEWWNRRADDEADKSQSE